MRRIVRLANFYAPESGGLRTTLDRLGIGLRRAGQEPVTIVPAAVDADMHAPWGRHITVASPPLPGGNGYRVMLDRRRLRRLLDQLEPDTVEVSDKLSLGWIGRWAGQNGVNSVLFSHERIDAILSGRVPRAIPLSAVADRWNKRLARSFGRIVCTSGFAAEEYERIGFSPVRVPLGVDLGTFTPGPITGIEPDDHIDLITVSRLSTEKHVDLAIATLRHLVQAGRDARLTVVGSGPDRARLESQARGLPVEFAGHVHDRPTLARRMAAATVGIAPCPAETFGLAPLELMACGVPIVVTKPGGTCELIGPESGRAVEPRAGAMADAVLELTALSPHRRRTEARAQAEQFSWEVTVKSLLDLYGSATGTASPPASAPVPAEAGV